MATDNWLDGSADWTVAADWSGGVPTSTSDVVVAQGALTATASIGLIHSLTDSAKIVFADAGSSAVSSFLTIASGGVFQVDAGAGKGGTSLLVGGALNNAGALTIGNATLSAATSVAVGSLVNSGALTLKGGAATQASLSVNGAAGLGSAGTITGTVRLSGDSLLDFGNGQISTIASGASLRLVGAAAFVASGSAESSNSALAGLSTVSGTLELDSGATVAPTGNLSVDGTLALDVSGGGSQFQVGGALSNAGTIKIGSKALAADDGVTAASLTNSAGEKVVLAGSATHGASLSVSGSVTNNGTLRVDAVAGAGSSSLAVSGALTNSGSLTIGNTSLAAADQLTVNGFGGLLNSTTGVIALIGGGANGPSLDGAALSNRGTMRLDAAAGAGGSSLTLTGKLTNLGALSVGSLSLSGDDSVSTQSLATGAFSVVTLTSGVGGTVSLDTSGAVQNAGTIKIDAGAGAGGSIVDFGSLSNTVAPQIVPQPAVIIGNTTLSKATAVTTQSVVNANGSISLVGSSTVGATLLVNAFAGFDQTGILTGATNLSGDALLEFQSGQISTIAANAVVSLTGANAFIADEKASSSNSALTGLSEVDGELFLANGETVNASAASALTIGSNGVVSLDNNSGTGGSRLAVGHALNIGDFLSVGNQTLSSADTVSAASLADAVGANVLVTGATAANVQATLDIAGAAGFGQAGVLIGQVRLSGDSLIEFDGGGQIGSIAAGSSLVLDGVDARIADSIQSGSNSALAGLTSVHGALALSAGAAIVTTGNLTVDGTTTLGDSATGSALSIGGGLANSGAVTLFSLGASALSIGGSLNNSGTATLDNNIRGGSTLSVGGAFDNTGEVEIGVSDNLSAGSMANSGGGAIDLFGGSTRQTFSVSGGVSNAGGSSFTLHGGVLTVGAQLSNAGFLIIETPTATSTTAARVTVGSLTNSSTGVLAVSGGASARAELDVAGAAGFGSGTALVGQVLLSGQSLVRFDSGQITSVGLNSLLDISGSSAFIADASGVNSNSALVGLASVAGTLGLGGGAKITTSGAISVGSHADILLDTASGDGGSTLSIGGALNNNGTISIGNANLSAATTVLATALSGAGHVHITGAAAVQATLDVTGGVNFAGVLAGDIELTQDSLLEFGSGQITTIASASELSLDGAKAFVADKGATTSNSALAGLSTVAGSLFLLDGAQLSTKSPLTIGGTVNVDSSSNSRGGSKLAVGGAITNELGLSIGNSTLSASAVVTAASLKNAGGFVHLKGSASVQAELALASGAGFGQAGVASGDIELSGDSLLEFANGALTSIASGSILSLDGAHAFVADSGTLSSNSALTQLQTISGALDLDDGGTIATTVGMTVAGILALDGLSAAGGAHLSIGGALTNNGNVSIGNAALSASDNVTAATLTNNSGHTISLTGHGAGHATLSVAGSIANNGTVSIASDVEELAGAISGTGMLAMSSGSTLRLDHAVGSGQTVSYKGADELILGQAPKFLATIAGFGAHDSIDVLGFGTGTTFNYVENSGNNGGVLTLTNDTSTARLNFVGIYSNANFSMKTNGGESVIGFVA